MYDRILVPIDGPCTDDPAVHKAISIAERHDATLVLLHVVRTERMTSVSMESAWPGVLTIAREEGEAIIESAEGFVRSNDMTCEALVSEGSPSREIVSAAREEGCDLIVMTTSGRNGLNRLLLGSVAERVVRQSPVPVLTVQRPNEPNTDEGTIDANVTS